MKNHPNNRSPGVITQVADAAAGGYAYSVAFTVVAVFVLGVANFVHTFMSWWGLLVLGALAVAVVAGAKKRKRMPQVQRMLVGMGLLIVFLSLPHILLDGPVPLGSLPVSGPHEPGQIDAGRIMASFHQAYLLLSANLMYILMTFLAVGCLMVWRKAN